MVFEIKQNINMCDDAKNDARLNVLFSPFRKREVNPQDWESKMKFWKSNITKWCLDSNICVFSQSKLQSVFVRNGRPASCLTTVLEDMLRNNEIVRLQDLLSRDPSVQSWSTWTVNTFVKTPLVWSFSKLKDSIISRPSISCDEEYVSLAALKTLSEHMKDNCWEIYGKAVISLEEFKSIGNVRDEQSIKAILHWLQLQGQAMVSLVNNKTILKLAHGGERVGVVSEADVGLYHLQQNERALMHMLEQLETERQAADQEARDYIKKGMRQTAKTCLRKRREIEKCIEKRASALENVQVLLSRVKEAESDGKILESYKMSLSALKATFKDAGLSEDSVGDTMDQVREVLEVHEEVQSALSEPVAASLDEDLEKELAELLCITDDGVLAPSLLPTPPSLADLPEPPTQSPSTSPATVSNKIAQQLA